MAGQASGSELRRVENHLLDCPLCADAVEGYSLDGGQVAMPDFSSFMDQMAVPGESGGAKIRQLNPTRRLMRFAASAAAVLLVLAGYFAFFQDTPGEKLYAQFYTSYENDIPTARRGGEFVPLNDHLVAGLEKYESKDFTGSIPHLEKVPAEDQNIHAARFFAGMANCEAGNWQAAIEQFIEVEKANVNYSQKAAWFHIMAQLQLGDVDAARVLLEDYVKARYSFKKDEAVRLLKKM